jgi:hypothetical protein
MCSIFMIWRTIRDCAFKRRIFVIWRAIRDCVRIESIAAPAPLSIGMAGARGKPAHTRFPPQSRA